MDHDDDVEHLFSWLQTPELRYREFAGAREITDAVIAQLRPNRAEVVPVPPRGDTQLQEEYPADQFPDQRDASEDVVIRAPERAPPAPPTSASAPLVPPPVPAIPPMPRPAAPNPAPAPFALGAEGRSAPRRPQYEEPVAPPAGAAPAVRPTALPMPPPPPPPPLPTAAVTAPPAPPHPAPVGGGLLGGAYRAEGLNGHDTAPPAAAAARTERSLDAVFGRLAGGRRPIEPRERLRHIPGLGPPPNRSR
jgi:hypothetical protein